MHKNALNRAPHIKYELLFLLNQALEAVSCARNCMKHAEGRGSCRDKDPDVKAGWPVWGNANITRQEQGVRGARRQAGQLG